MFTVAMNKKARTYKSYSKIRLDGRKLARLRANKQLTQTDVARRAGIGRLCYVNAERGCLLQPAKAGAIAEFYNTPLEELEARSA